MVLAIGGLGCLTGMCLAVAGVVYVISNLGNFAVSGAAALANAQVDNSQLPDDQKTRLRAQVDRLADGVKSDEITMEQAARVVDKFMKGPFLHLAVVTFADAHYIQTSSLTDEQKAEAKLNLQRVARGVTEDQIDYDRLDYIAEPVSAQNAQGENRFKPTLSSDELDEFLGRTKEVADEANIPNEPYELDIADLFEQAVDDVMEGESPGP